VDDQAKTKEQLIHELRAMRNRMGELEKLVMKAEEDTIDLKRFKTVCNTAKDLVYICDRKGHVLYLNDIFEKFSGCKPAQFIGKSFAPLFKGEDLKKAKTLYQRTLKGESPQDEIAFWQTGVLCEYKNVPFRDNDGKVIGVIGTARDTTERNEMEGSLKENEKKYRLLVKHMNDGFGLLNDKGIITYVNRQLCEMLGYSEDELLGTPITSLFDDENKKILRKQLAARKKGDKGRYEIKHTRKDGSTITTIMSPQPIIDTKGRYGGSFAVITDITQRKRAEDALRRAHDILEKKVQKRTEELTRTIADLQSEIRGRRNVESALRKSTTYIDAMGEALIVLNMQKKVTDVNKAALRLLGYKRDEIVNLSFKKIVPVREHVKHYTVMKYIFETGDVMPFETILLTKEGREIPVLLSSTVIHDAETKPLGLIGVCRDITDRKHAEEALRESEDRYRTIVENAGIPHTIISKDGTFLFVNMVGARNLGGIPADFVGQSIHTILPDQANSAMKRTEKAIKSEKEFHYEDYVKLPSGNRWFSSSVRPLRDPCGELSSVQIVSLDITERKRAEEALKEREKLYRTLVETIPYGIIENDLTGYITFSNAAYKRMLGYEENEIKGRFIWDNHTSKKEKETLRQYLKMLVKDQPEPTPYTVKKITRDGSVIDVHVDWNFKRDKNGKLTGFISVVTDITKRKESEKQIAMNYEIQRVLSTILQTSLQPISLKKILDKTLDILLSIPFFSLHKQGSIFLVNQDGSKLEMVVHKGLNKSLVKTCSRLPLGSYLCGKAVDEKKVVFSYRVDERHQNRHEGISSQGHCCVPILSGDQKLGAIDTYVAECHQRESQEVQFLIIVANTLAGIIERKRAEADLKKKSETLEALNRELRKLSAQLSEKDETSRRKFAKILHEQVGQNLLAMKIACKDVMREFPSRKPQMRKAVSHLISTLDETIESTRALTSELYPVVLDRLGYMPALSWYCDMVVKKRAIKISADIDDCVESLPTKYKLSLFRIAQEALQNIVKHASPSEVAIELKKVKNSLRLTVEDNGIGFDFKKIEKKRDKGIGLMLMRERAFSLGGDCVVTSVLGKGTKILVDIPVKK
jgi:PAS domain S-box-containing protein